MKVALIYRKVYGLELQIHSQCNELKAIIILWEGICISIHIERRVFVKI